MSDVPDGPLAALREQSRKGVQYLLNYMLANAEQYLLGLAGKADAKGELAYAFVPAGAEHQFRNVGAGVFRFMSDQPGS